MDIKQFRENASEKDESIVQKLNEIRLQSNSYLKLDLK